MAEVRGRDRQTDRQTDRLTFAHTHTHTHTRARARKHTYQVCWHWKYLCDSNVLWHSKCVCRGWFLPCPPLADTDASSPWKTHYVNCVSHLHWRPPTIVRLHNTHKHTHTHTPPPSPLDIYKPHLVFRPCTYYHDIDYHTHTLCTYMYTHTHTHTCAICQNYSDTIIHPLFSLDLHRR